MQHQCLDFEGFLHEVIKITSGESDSVVGGDGSSVTGGSRSGGAEETMHYLLI